MGRNGSRLPARRIRADWWRWVGTLVLLLMAGCEVAGGGAADGTLSDIPGTATGDEPVVVVEDVQRPMPVVAEGVDITEESVGAIRDGALAYVGEATAIPDIRIEIDAVADGWARVRALPTGEETDPATLYLRQDGDSWRGVSIGTAFTPEDLDEMGVPAAVRP